MLFKKTYEELVSEAIDDLQYNTDITNLSIGGVARSLLEVINKQLSTYYDILEVNQAMGFVSTARGYFLDLIGQLFNIVRIQPQGASVTAEDMTQKFYVTRGFLSDHIPGLFIPQGTMVATSDGEIQYSVTEDTPFAAGEKNVYVPIQSSSTGSGINVGRRALIWNSLGEVDVYTVNDKPIISGTNVESDENLRYRITNATLSAEKANETSIRLAALSVAGVADVILRKYAYGIGSYEVLVIPLEGLPTVALVDEVQDAIDKVQAYGIKGIAKSPSVVPVDLEVQLIYTGDVTSTERTNIADRVKVSIERYIVNIPVGGQFVLNELRQQIMNVSSKIRDHKIHCYYFREHPHMKGNVVIFDDEMFYPNPDSEEAIRVIGA